MRPQLETRVCCFDHRPEQRFSINVAAIAPTEQLQMGLVRLQSNTQAMQLVMHPFTPGHAHDGLPRKPAKDAANMSYTTDSHSAPPITSAHHAQLPQLGRRDALDADFAKMCASLTAAWLQVQLVQFRPGWLRLIKSIHCHSTSTGTTDRSHGSAQLAAGAGLADARARWRPHLLHCAEAGSAPGCNRAAARMLRPQDPLGWRQPPRPKQAAAWTRPQARRGGVWGGGGLAGRLGAKAARAVPGAGGWGRRRGRRGGARSGGRPGAREWGRGAAAANLGAAAAAAVAVAVAEPRALT